MTYLGIFGLEFENNIVIFEIKSPQICLITRLKIKLLRLGPKMPYLGSNFGKLLSYMKSTPSNLSHCIVRCRNKKS